MQNYSSQVTHTDSVIIATFIGEISTDHYTEFRHDYNEICRLLSQSNGKRVLIYLAGVTFFGSLFIGIILKLSIHTRRKKGVLAICGLTPQLKQLMQKLMLLERKPNGGHRLQHLATREESLAFLNGDCTSTLQMATVEQ